MRIAAAAAAFALALSAPAVAQDASRPVQPAVTVTGEGMAAAAPDLAVVTSGVVTSASTAGAALKANAAAMSAVLAKLKDAGVADRDVATSGLTVQPQYDYGSGDGGPRAPKLVAYEVRNTVTIRARDLDALGGLIDKLVAAGSNQIEGLAFEVSDRTAKLDAARKNALADARRKAELYATTAGARLGPVLSLEEQEMADEPIRPFALRAQAKDAAGPTPIARGEQEMRVRITAKWALER